MSPAVTLSLVSCGVFFLAALFLGVWKHLAMVKSPTHRAPVYVDIAHRAALLYAFAALVVAKFAEYSPFSDTVSLLAAGGPLLFFASTIGRYIQLGWRNETDNQYDPPTDMIRYGLWILIVAEVGGFGTLFVGFLMRRFSGG